MDFLGHYITLNALIFGPAIIILGFCQYLIYKYFITYSKDTVEELNDKSFLGMEGTQRTPTGGLITMIIGFIIFAIMFSADFFWGDKTVDHLMNQKVFEDIQKQGQKNEAINGANQGSPDLNASGVSQSGHEP